ncbi:hypothetical protein [Citrobacter portucalensis]|uniref:hypothetical protein n=1 Tax=Citrobacter portucalensis TaxID=1639133 RepID=UPI00226B874E|nr:hypothetical protein [Citrobacter portucalensis]MCX9070652.1 hypothetical protein [Citrobacter portucalensis]
MKTRNYPLAIFSLFFIFSNSAQALDSNGGIESDSVEVTKSIRTPAQCMRIAENFADMDVQKYKLKVWGNRANNNPYTTLADVSSDSDVINTARAMLKLKTDEYFNSCWHAQQD